MEKIGPEDYEKAKTQRGANKEKDILTYNCNKIKEWVVGYDWRRVGAFSCNSLERATQGLNPGSGSRNQVFGQSKFVKSVGEGAYGVAMLFDNGHIVKIFKGGIHGAGGDGDSQGVDALKAELKTYAKLLNSQFGGSAKSHDMAVYEYGTIPVYVPNAERDMINPIEYIGYAEIGKVIPFDSWILDNLTDGDGFYIEDFFSNDLIEGLTLAASRSETVLKYGSEMEKHHIRPFDQIEGGAKEYVD